MSKKGFAIISSQRSGSTMLVHILDQHPDLTCAGEIFKKKETDRILHPEFSFRLDQRKDDLNYKLAPKRIIRRHLKKCISADKNLFGFKLMTSQLELCPEIEPSIKSLGFARIVLVRENFIDQSLSLEIARSSKKWVNPANKSYEMDKVKLDMDSLARTTRYFQEALLRLKALGTTPETLMISYDQLTNDRESCLHRITDHLHVSKHFDYDLSLRPSSELSYADRISNFDDVEAYLSMYRVD